MDLAWRAALLLAALSSASAQSLPSTRTVINFLESMSTAQRSEPPSNYLSTAELVKGRGYGVEEYEVRTEDGYLVKLTRILGTKHAGRPVLIMHGILAASDQWLLLDADHCLPFILAKAGYDVWLGDQRGSVNSRSHVIYSPKDIRFWDFSFHEAGFYDLPAMIDHILSVSRHRQVRYVGHSMGTTVFMVMASSRPEYSAKVALALLLAPVATVPKAVHLEPFLNTALGQADVINNVLTQQGVYELLPRSGQTIQLVQKLCGPSPTQRICIGFVGMLYGENWRNWDLKKLGYYFSSVPSGTSIKTAHHFSQVYRTGRFVQYDYGPNENIIRYGSTEPPQYNLWNISVPVGLYYGVNDKLMNVQSANTLARTLPNVIRNYVVPDPRYSHVDFLFGLNTKDLVFNDILKVMNTLS